MYSKEDCGRNDPSKSPGSCTGRGAVTLIPTPNGAKVFYVARTEDQMHRGSPDDGELVEGKIFLLSRGNRT